MANGAAGFGIVPGANVSRRFIERDVKPASRADGPAIDRHSVVHWIDLCAQFLHNFSINGDLPGDNDLLRSAPRSHARIGQVLLEAHPLRAITTACVLSLP